MAKYDEISDFLIEQFDLDPDIFEINFENQTPIYEDIRIRSFQEHGLNDPYFRSYYYKDNIEQGWESIVLNMNRVHISEVFTRINEFLNNNNNELIDLISFNDALEDNSEFQFDFTDDRIVYLVGRVSQNEVFIDIARTKE